MENARVIPPLERVAQIAEQLGVTLDALITSKAA
jgi:hypothetical protein